ncbi:MAG TPA: sulfite exporter TauE/SafE family protein [Fimbriimonas sp.]|nr:sulfite exporter TauE/SafE family protein [Fimbriimonas sp.]
MTWLPLAALLVGGYAAATISGAAGFGGALLLLPIATWAVGAKEAIPLLTLGQLVGNLSRATLGWRLIRWKPALLFCVGAIPAALVGAVLFVAVPGASILRSVGVFLILVVLLRRTKFRNIAMPESVVAPGGFVVGFLSAVVGSAGPLGAMLFLGLGLPAGAYVATEAVTAVAMHLTKSTVYSSFSLVTTQTIWIGALLSLVMVAGSWTGKKIIESLPKDKFELVVELLLLSSATSLLIFAR